MLTSSFSSSPFSFQLSFWQVFSWRAFSLPLSWRVFSLLFSWQLSFSPSWARASSRELFSSARVSIRRLRAPAGAPELRSWAQARYQPVRFRLLLPLLLPLRNPGRACRRNHPSPRTRRLRRHAGRGFLRTSFLPPHFPDALGAGCALSSRRKDLERQNCDGAGL